MGFLNRQNPATLVTGVLCTIPLFDPSFGFLVCSHNVLGTFTHSYMVAMDFFFSTHTF